MSGCLELQVLDVAKSRRVRNPIICLEQLERLDLEDTQIASPSVICPKLKQLSISQCRALPHEEILKLLQASPLLHGIKMCGLPSVCDETATHVAELCKDVRLLSLSGTCTFTDLSSVPFFTIPTAISASAVELLIAELPQLSMLLMHLCTS